ncbi:MAG: type II secretion system F family protein [Lachnospira sp.]|nr:type II secretion system F family protein [Lachnospira sp.]
MKKWLRQVFQYDQWGMYVKGIGLIVATAYLFYGNVFVAILLCPYLLIYFRNEKKRSLEQRQLCRRQEFKDGILAVSFALKVGYSVENAFREAIGELAMLYGKDNVTVREFQEIVRRTDQNENMEDVLSEYAARSRIEDIEYFAEVFHFAKRSGGNLISIIGKTAEVIRDKTEISRQIHTIVSGKRMEQRVMSVIPYGMIVYLKLTSPEFIQPLYGNTAGIVVMSICLFLLLVSNLWSKRIVNIEI